MFQQIFLLRCIGDEYDLCLEEQKLLNWCSSFTIFNLSIFYSQNSNFALNFRFSWKKYEFLKPSPNSTFPLLIFSPLSPFFFPFSRNTFAIFQHKNSFQDSFSTFLFIRNLNSWLKMRTVKFFSSKNRWKINKWLPLCHHLPRCILLYFPGDWNWNDLVFARSIVL